VSAKHTPGPYAAEENCGELHIISGADDEVLATVHSGRADANLFAAAAEMAEALIPFAQYACDSPHVDEPMCHNCRARAALAKARGEA
jgi:hypothetical protein